MRSVMLIMGAIGASSGALVTVGTVLRAMLLLLEILLALPLLYLLTVVVGAIKATLQKTTFGHRAAAPDLPATTFAIVVPAYNEESLIASTLESLAQLDYPSNLYAVHVIADNCTDRTAEIARSAGVHVHERSDAVDRGKGYALAWALGLLMQRPTHYDAYIILDADTVVEPALLRAFAAGLQRGARALQSHNAVLNANDSPTAALRWLALSLMNYIRPLGRNSWGGSSTLTGNGMCLTHEMLTLHPWRAFGLAEDYQYYLDAVASGERVLFVPDANVRSVMPNTPRQLQSQDLRWESLEPDSSRWRHQIARRLFFDGIRRRDYARLDAFAELITPPLSVLAAGCALVLAASLALGTLPQILLALLLLGVLLAYVCSPFLLLRPPAGVYGALVFGPAYIARKLWVYFVLRRRRKHTGTWVRTARAASTGRDRVL